MIWHIEKRKVSDLKSYEDNPRILTKKGLADLKQSVEKFGLAEPIVVNTDGTIIGGHARAKVLNPNDEVDVYVPDRLLDESEYKELNIRLNKNIAGEWDFDILANKFDMDDLQNWGFDEAELGLGHRVKEDDVPALPKDEPTVKYEIYQLGGHRLMCGDATKEEDVNRLMNGLKADMVFTPVVK